MERDTVFQAQENWRCVLDQSGAKSTPVALGTTCTLVLNRGTLCTIDEDSTWPRYFLCWKPYAYRAGLSQGFRARNPA